MRRSRGCALVLLAIAVLVLSSIGGLPSHSRTVYSPTASSGGGSALSSSSRPLVGAFALGDNGVSPAAISLNWTASTQSCFTNYSVYYSRTAASGPWAFATSVTTAGSPNAVVSDLTPGGAYWWNVTVFYRTGLLCLGGTAQSSSDVLAESQPSLAYLTSPANTSSTVNLSWTNNATYGGGISFGSYRVIEVVNGAPSTYTTVSTLANRNVSVSGLQAGSSYSFYVNTVDLCSACGAGGNSTTRSNVVLAGTATTLTASLTSTRSTADAGQLVGFTCTPSGGTPPYSFRWNFTNGTTTFTSGPSTESHAYVAPASSYEVRCDVTDHALTHYLSAAVAVAVNSDPKVVASVSPLNATRGSAVTLSCYGTGGTATLHASWALGDGASLTGTGGAANGSYAYPSTGSFTATCTVVDGAGVHASVNFLIRVHAPSPWAWVTPALGLGLALAVGVVLAVLVALARRREEASERSSALSRWLPPTGPATTVHGAKICPKCGASNVPLRRTCQACGTPLPRT